jgi:mono/diheme cytochrome c family protein
MFRFLVGIVLGIALVPVAILVWIRFGDVPVAVSDSPFPHEQQITGIPLKARIDREMVATPPIQPDNDNLLAGAHVYGEKCAMCHGFHGKPSATGTHMFPDAPPLWEKHHGGAVVGVSDDPPGETYWKVANGIRLTGMPAYRTQLTDTEIWQVSLLLANADKPLPPAALELLRGDPARALVAAQPGTPRPLHPGPAALLQPKPVERE